MKLIQILNIVKIKTIDNTNWAVELLKEVVTNLKNFRKWILTLNKLNYFSFAQKILLFFNFLISLLLVMEITA